MEFNRKSKINIMKRFIMISAIAFSLAACNNTETESTHTDSMDHSMDMTSPAILDTARMTNDSDTSNQLDTTNRGSTDTSTMQPN